MLVLLLQHGLGGSHTRMKGRNGGEVRQEATPHPPSTSASATLRATADDDDDEAEGDGRVGYGPRPPRSSSLHRVRGKRKRARNAPRSRPTSLSITKPIAPTSARAPRPSRDGRLPARPLSCRDFAGGACVSDCLYTTEYGSADRGRTRGGGEAASATARRVGAADPAIIRRGEGSRGGQ